MTWALQDAKSRFSAVADDAWHGEPQVVTRRGKPLVVVISYDLYRSKIMRQKKSNIVEAFMSCPADVDLDDLIAPRSRDSGRTTQTNFAAEE